MVTASLALLCVGAHAHEGYRMEPIVRIGDTVAGRQLTTGYAFFLGPLADDGRLLIDAGIPSQTPNRPDMLFEYAGGSLSPVAVPGQEGPVGAWPEDLLISVPLAMNQKGNAVFTTGRIDRGNFTFMGTFLREREAGAVKTLVLKGMPATAGLTFAIPAGFAPAINNQNEVVLVGSVRDPNAPSGSTALYLGIFLAGRDGRLLPILTPVHELPGGGRVVSDGYPHPEPSLNDTGAVAFLARRPADKHSSAFRWEQGTLTPLASVGDALPGGGRITSVSQVLLNNRDRSALIALAAGNNSRHGLYRQAEGKLVSVAATGQAMPGGGTLRSLRNLITLEEGARCQGVSSASEAGDHVFLATLEDGSTAAYRVAADGSLSLVLKSGATTSLGKITQVGGNSQPSINSQGQIALVVRIDDGPQTVLLLTPDRS
jgi:hypothetical protein